jgi:DsbE subfamily thiol:disulfide oxidoreductase
MPNVPSDPQPRAATAAAAPRLLVPALVLVALLAVLVGGVLAVQRRIERAGVDRFTVGAAAQQPVDVEVRRRVVGLEGRLLADDRPWSSTAVRGSVLVVNYWASWCAPCRAEQPDLTRVARGYAARGVAFVGVNVNDDRASARAYVRGLGVPYPSLFDPKAQTAARLGVVGLPTTFVVDRDGMVGYQRTGKSTAASLSGRLDALLAAGGRWPG